MPSSRFLFSNGVVSHSSKIPPVMTFLEGHQGRSLHTTHSHNSGSFPLFWERRLKRLCDSVWILLDSYRQLLFRVKERGDGEELSITALITVFVDCGFPLGEVQYFIGVQLDGNDHVEPFRNRLSEKTERQSAKLVKATTENVNEAIRELLDDNLLAITYEESSKHFLAKYTKTGGRAVGVFNFKNPVVNEDFVI